MSLPPLLLPYQQRWVADESRVQVCVKTRRCGITWASALRAVLESGAERGFDTYYTGYNHDLAQEFIRDAGEFAKLLHVAFKQGTELFEDVDAEGNPREILAYTIRFNSGFRIVALSSKPRNLRGKQGRIIIDEAAFHDDLPEMVKAAMATLMWGGRVSIISTHNGAEHPFNLLIEDVKAGRFDYSLHTITLDDALAQGLYQRIAMVLGLEDTPAAQAKWRQDLVDFYGDGADEELFCIPRRGGGIYIPPALVEACMTKDWTVHRLKLDDAFALKTEAEQAEHMTAWMTAVVDPALMTLERIRDTFIGWDFGRKSDLSVISLGQFAQNLTLNTPVMFELRNVPYEQQKAFGMHLLRSAPKVGRLAIDSAGNGNSLGEALVIGFGEALVTRVGVEGNGWLNWYANNLPKFKARFEEQTILLPKDVDVKSDLATFQVIDGVPKLPKLRKESKRPDAAAGEYRHGDAGVALALMDYAAREGSAAIVPNQRHVRPDPLERSGGHGRFRVKGMW